MFQENRIDLIVLQENKRTRKNTKHETFGDNHFSKMNCTDNTTLLPDAKSIFYSYLKCFEIYMNLYNVSNEAYTSISEEFIR